MSGKDMLIDFLNYVFLILLSVFFLFYFVFGDRLEMMKDIMRMLIPFSAFGILFLVVLRIRVKNVRKYKEQGSLDEPVCFLSAGDRRKDLIVRFGAPFIMLSIPALDGKPDLVDIAQTVLVFTFNIFWHWLLFKQKTNRDLPMNRLDRVKDELFIYFIPVAVLGMSALNQTIDTIDIMQALAVYVVLYSWHLIIFKK